jgi:hypothetical protein
MIIREENENGTACCRTEREMIYETNDECGGVEGS